MKQLLVSLTLLTAGLSYAGGAYTLYDYEQHEYQVSYNSYEVRPIASITKLFTAVTILRSGVELTERVKVKGQSGGRFPNGMMVTRHDLMKAMMISSDNRAAETLANTYPGGYDQFIQDANAYIRGRGLIHTSIEDPTGLSKNNVSTANELISFLGAVKDNEALRSYADDKTADILIPKGKRQIHIKLHNTNPSIFKFDNILISKTGYTNPAGRCVVMLVEKDKKHYGIVVLGQKNIQERSQLANGLITAEPLPPRPVVKEPDPIEFGMPM
jgi:D-alanyl-D-alanine carboxypeptidase/D-alanyl-D-alanine endopeptidase (penicillin-binding protein 7)